MLRTWLNQLRKQLSGGKDRSRNANRRPRSLRLSLEPLEGRILLSTTLVTNTTAYPYSAVVQILTTFPHGQVEQGTGTMVNQNTVLTAGHMVYNYSDGGWAKSIEVIPGRNGNREPYGVAYATSAETFNSFIADDRRNSNGHSAGDGDVGFISLNRNLGYSTGWLGFMGVSAADYYVNKVGYPGTDGYNGNQMYYDFGRLNTYGGGTVSGFGYWGWSTSSMSAIPGESGSSLILDINGRLGIIGVQDLGPTSGRGEGYAEMTTQTVVNALTSFERTHPAASMAGAMVQVGAQAVGTTGQTKGVATETISGEPSSPSPLPAATSPSSALSPPVVSPPSPAPDVASEPPSPVQLFLDGINLALTLSGSGEFSAALADAALMHDIDSAPGRLFNSYLDAGLLAALSALDDGQDN